MGTRIRTNKGNKKGCRNKALSVAALFTVFAVVLMGVSGCKTNPETCEVTARDNATVTLTCTDKKGNSRKDTLDVYSDLYPNCQVGTFWPGCKGR
jgi:hypothetical protein